MVPARHRCAQHDSLRRSELRRALSYLLVLTLVTGCLGAGPPAPPAPAASSPGAATAGADTADIQGRVDPLFVNNPPLACGATSGSPGTYQNRGITLPVPHLPARETHPVVDFSADDLPALRARISGAAPDPHGLYRRNWQKILADAQAGSAGGASADDRASRRAKAAGFVYALTQDTAQRAAAVAALQGAFTSIENDDELVAAQLTNYAQAYDYAGASLSADDPDTAAARAAVKRGAQWLADWLSGKNPSGSNPRPHNHRSKAATALGLWALVFAADPAAGPWLQLASDQLNSVYQYMFTKDGVYLDGYGYYWTYQYWHALPYFYAARNAGGADPFPALQPVFEWMVRDSSPQGWLMNAEDGWLKLTWTAVVAPAYTTTRTALHSREPLAGVLQWRFFNQDWDAVQYPNGWNGATNQSYVWPDEIAHVDGAIPEVAPDAPGLQFFDRGGNTSVLRSDWRYNDPKSRWVQLYGAPQSNNHDHCDAMQVLLAAENAILLTDDGYGPQRFDGRNPWIVAPQHNVVTLDGKGANDVYANTLNLAGALSDYAEKLAYFDQPAAGQSGSKSWRRGVLFAAHDYAVVVDTLRAPAEATWAAFWHGRGAFTRGGVMATWTTPKNAFGSDAKLYLLAVAPGGMLAERQGQTNLYGASAGPPATESNTALSVTVRAAATQLATLAVPRATTAAAPALTDMSAGSAGDLVAARVVMDGNTDVVFASPSRQARSVSGVVGDGRVVWVRATGSRIAGWTLIDGTTLGANGKALFRASVPLSATADLRGASPVIDVQARGRYTLSVPATAGSATFDGTPVAGTVSGGVATFTLDGSGRLVLGPPR